MQTKEGSPDTCQTAPQACPVQHADLAFGPFSQSYLADPYPFFAEARTASPVFYKPDLDYWVATRYHDIRHIFQTPSSEVFDIHRPNAKDHLSFGHGPPLCLGAPLSRLEARVVLEELSSRLPSLRIVPDQTFCFLPNFSFRGPRSLLAEWDG